jgi:hypothetical protein
MTISQIETIVEQGRKAFADGKKLEHNPYVNNPEFHMHWQNGFHQAAMEAPTTDEQPQAEQTEVEDEQPKEEAPVEEAKPTKSTAKAKE